MPMFLKSYSLSVLRIYMFWRRVVGCSKPGNLESVYTQPPFRHNVKLDHKNTSKINDLLNAFVDSCT